MTKWNALKWYLLSSCHAPSPDRSTLLGQSCLCLDSASSLNNWLFCPPNTSSSSSERQGEQALLRTAYYLRFPSQEPSGSDLQRLQSKHSVGLLLYDFLQDVVGLFSCIPDPESGPDSVVWMFSICWDGSSWLWAMS